jgi:hypothetical protein
MDASTSQGILKNNSSSSSRIVWILLAAAYSQCKVHTSTWHTVLHLLQVEAQAAPTDLTRATVSLSVAHIVVHAMKQELQQMCICAHLIHSAVSGL